ncbi:MAG TPA: helix-turn-helix domain-containing protein [Pedococcus sp.]
MSKLPLGPLGGDNLGDYLREQRQSARLSLRQLSALAGISNPYLSQIERGLKRPSAEILQQLAKGLEVSAESLYVRAGILEERQPAAADVPDTRAVISADPALTPRQRTALLDIYDSFVHATEVAAEPAPARSRKAAPRTTASRKAASRKAASRKAATGTSASRATTTRKTAARRTTTDRNTTDRPTTDRPTQ